MCCVTWEYIGFSLIPLGDVFHPCRWIDLPSISIDLTALISIVTLAGAAIVSWNVHCLHCHHDAMHRWLTVHRAQLWTDFRQYDKCSDHDIGLVSNKHWRATVIFKCMFISHLNLELIIRVLDRVHIGYLTVFTKLMHDMYFCIYIKDCKMFWDY